MRSLVLWIRVRVLTALSLTASLSLLSLGVLSASAEESPIKAVQTEVTKVKAVKATETLPVANTQDFKSTSKAERLEDLRYKHLWIAYSLVWLIIFFFIRQTWTRHQAVAGRLDELQKRLQDIENKN